jgi:hypothetical protein
MESSSERNVPISSNNGSLADEDSRVAAAAEVEAFLVAGAGGRLGLLLTRRHANGLPAASRTRTHTRSDGARTFTRAEYWRLPRQQRSAKTEAHHTLRSHRRGARHSSSGH